MPEVRPAVCMLDCFDVCKVELKEERLQAVEASRGLCWRLNRGFGSAKRLRPRVDGKEVSLQEALKAAFEALKGAKSLLYRGSGNIGAMQDVTNLLAKRLGMDITEGSLCDGAGAAGIKQACGVNRMLLPHKIDEAEVVVLWGRGVDRSSPYTASRLGNKTFIVIDPIVTSEAKRARLHLQIEPRSDIYLAIMLARFAMMGDYGIEVDGDVEDFYDFTREFRLKPLLEYTGIELEQMGEFLELIRDKKTLFLIGTGVQKYSHGSDTLWAICSLANVLGLYQKEGSGVQFLGDSRVGYTSPFAVDCNRVSKVDTPFDNYDTVLIQGANPLESMPNTVAVGKKLNRVKRLIVFGLWEDATSQAAHITIPACSFLAKEDVRLSYGGPFVSRSSAVCKEEGIGEYEFVKRAFEWFGFEGLKAQDHYIDLIMAQCEPCEDGLVLKGYRADGYKEGFGMECDEEFCFIEEYEDCFVDPKRFRSRRAKGVQKQEGLWLLSVKSSHSQNSQFSTHDELFIHPAHGFKDGDEVELIASDKSATFRVKNSNDIKPTAVMVYAGSKGLNRLTPSTISQEGHSACFQEVKVIIKEKQS